MIKKLYKFIVRTTLFFAIVVAMQFMNGVNIRYSFNGMSYVNCRRLKNYEQKFYKKRDAVVDNFKKYLRKIYFRGEFTGSNFNPDIPEQDAAVYSQNIIDKFIQYTEGDKGKEIVSLLEDLDSKFSSNWGASLNCENLTMALLNAFVFLSQGPEDVVEGFKWVLDNSDRIVKVSEFPFKNPNFGSGVYTGVGKMWDYIGFKYFIEDSKSVGEFLQHIKDVIGYFLNYNYEQPIYSHEITQRAAIHYNSEEGNWVMGINFYLKKPMLLIGRNEVTLSKTGADIFTCGSLKSFIGKQKLAEEMVARTYLIAYETLQALGIDGSWAIGRYAMMNESDTQERADIIDAMFNQLGFVQYHNVVSQFSPGKEELQCLEAFRAVYRDKYAGDSYIWYRPLENFVAWIQINWKELFYKRRIESFYQNRTEMSFEDRGGDIGSTWQEINKQIDWKQVAETRITDQNQTLLNVLKQLITELSFDDPRRVNIQAKIDSLFSNPEVVKGISSSASSVVRVQRKAEFINDKKLNAIVLEIASSRDVQVNIIADEKINGKRWIDWGNGIVYVNGEPVFLNAGHETFDKLTTRGDREELIEEFKKANPDKEIIAVLPNGNAMFNDWFVSYANGALLYNEKEPVFKRTYSSLIIMKNGDISIRDIKFEEDKVEDVIKIWDVKKEQSIEDEVLYTTYGQKLVEDGNIVNLVDIYDEFDDLSHLFYFPLIPVGGREIIAGHLAGEMHKNKTLIKAALEGKSIDFDVSWITNDELRERLNQAGYNETASAGEIKKQGDYVIAGNVLSIKLIRNQYRHFVAGIKDGKLITISILGKSGKYGATIEEAAEIAKREGINDAILLCNGRDVWLQYQGDWIEDTGRGAISSVIIVARNREDIL